jgi:hypothetical protein
VNTIIFKANVYITAQRPKAEWLAQNPSTYGKQLPAKLTHISQWVVWMLNTDDMKGYKYIVEDMLFQIDQLLDVAC